MAETLISPGVFLQENDLSQIQQGPITVGAAILGPTVYGPVNIPTVVRSYGEYKAKFGSLFVSGGTNYEYLTSIAALNYFEQGGETLLVTRVASGTFTSATASILSNYGFNTASFVIETLSQGIIMNNDYLATQPSSSLQSGSINNIRWEISFSDTGSGLFTLTLRRGDDIQNQKIVLETWNNLSLDPNSANYVSYVIGDQVITPAQDETGAYYLQYSGAYPNQSRYIRIKSVNLPTPNLLDNTGRIRAQYTSSIPAMGSGSANGSFGGGRGTTIQSQAMKLFENIPSSPIVSFTDGNIQGVVGSSYGVGIGLLGNKDQYDFKTIYAPGINAQNSSATVSDLLQLAQNRGTCIAVVDMTSYQQNITTATQQAITLDSSYGATYWPWIQLRSRETGKLFFCPASTIVPAVYEYSDRISAEWFAPAGLTRGGLTTVIQPERRLTVAQRDILYTSKINPIAIFPGQGTVIYGQKTLQAKATALDRVNVRRLLIALKRYIGQIAETLVFEQNTQTTRNSFLNQVNPYLQYVQQKQGLYAFRVVMDDTNNTPDVIDRNQLVGSIYLQPTRTAEYILLDFNVLPTGATFGS